MSHHVAAVNPRMGGSRDLKKRDESSVQLGPVHTAHLGEETQPAQFRRSINMASTITTAAAGSTIFGSQGIERKKGVI
jgi:hypothetical protein